MTTLDSAAKEEKAARAAQDALGVFCLFSLSARSMWAQPNSCRRNAAADELPQALSQDSLEKEGNVAKEEDDHGANWIFIELKAPS